MPKLDANEASKRKQEQAQSKRLQAAAVKQGEVASMFSIDFSKLGCQKFTTMAFEKLETAPMNFTEPFQVRLGQSGPSCKMPAVNELLQVAEIDKHLNSYRNGFPNSIASTQGKMKMSHAVQAGGCRAALLRSLGAEEFVSSDNPLASGSASKQVEWPKDLQDLVHVYGEGERYTAFGTMPYEAAAVKFAVTGQSMVVAVCAMELESFLAPKKKGSSVKLQDMKQFLENLQPPEVVAFLEATSSCVSPAIVHGMVSEQSLLYLPPGWICCEKTLNSRVCLGLRISFLPKGTQQNYKILKNVGSLRNAIINATSHNNPAVQRVDTWLACLRSEVAEDG